MCSVFVGNIAWDVSEQELGDWFSQCGRVLSAYIKVDQATGNTLGYGFVEFSDATIADQVIAKMEGSILAGRNLRCNRSNRPNAKINNFGGQGAGIPRQQGYGQGQGQYGQGAHVQAAPQNYSGHVGSGVSYKPNGSISYHQPPVGQSGPAAAAAPVGPKQEYMM